MDLDTKLQITRQERIKFLFNHGKACAYTSMFGAGLIFALLSLMDRYNHWLLGWAISLGGLGAFRIFLLYKFTTPENSIQQSEKHLKLYTATLVIAGFIWGLLTLCGGAGHTDATLIIPIIAISIVASTALPTLAPISSVYLIFLLSISVPAIIGMLTTQGINGLYFGIALLSATPLLFLSSRRLEHSLTESLWLQYEVKGLLAEVNSKNKKLETLNADLQETQAIFDQEEEVARHVFNQLIHSSEDSPDHCQYWVKPMMSFSGDIIQMAQGPKGEEYILLGDFTGHGLPAALGAVPTSAIFKTMAHKGLPVHLIAEELNRKLCELLPTGYFCCAAIMMVSAKRDSATIWNGGLPEIIITNQQSGRSDLISSSQLPLGIQPSTMSADDAVNVALDYDDFIYIYSDGVTEVENTKNEMLGSEAFKKIIARPATNNSRMDIIKMAVLSFADGAAASDDISLIEYHCVSNNALVIEPELEASN